MYLFVLLVVMAQFLTVVSDTMILNGNGAPPCIRTCVGEHSGGWDGSCKYIYIPNYIDIAGCGFVSAPQITATLDTIKGYLSPAGAVYRITSAKFGYLFASSPVCQYYSWSSSTQIKSVVNSYFKLSWQAVGYIC